MKETIVKIRNIRAEMGVAATKKVHLFVKTDYQKLYESAVPYLERLAGISALKFVADKAEAGNKVCGAVTSNAEIFIPLGELVDLDKEQARLSKEIAKVEGEIKRSEGMLGNAGFIAKAPAALVEKEKAKLQENKNLVEKLKAQLEDLK